MGRDGTATNWRTKDHKAIEDEVYDRFAAAFCTKEVHVEDMDSEAEEPEEWNEIEPLSKEPKKLFKRKDEQDDNRKVSL